MDATTFPISFSYHLIFCVIAGLFFLFQFLRVRRPYQLIFAIGIVGSLAIYLDTSSKSLFHAVGLFELVLLVGAIVLSITDRVRRKREAKETETVSAETSEADSEETSEESEDAAEDEEEPKV